MYFAICNLKFKGVVVPMSVNAVNKSQNVMRDEAIVNELKKEIYKKENDLENTENLKRNFEKVMELVNIFGQLDDFLVDRTKNMIKKLAVFAGDEKKFE